MILLPHAFERLPCPTVLLAHEVPGGASHVDWLIARDPAGDGSLASFRLPRRLDSLEAGEEMQAERIADHRPIYLEYEGELSRNRGVVKRLARGEVTWMQRMSTEDALMMKIDWPDARQRLTLSRSAGNQWRIACVQHEPAEALSAHTIKEEP